MEALKLYFSVFRFAFPLLMFPKSDEEHLKWHLYPSLVAVKSHYKCFVAFWLTNQKKEFYKLTNQRIFQSICSIMLTTLYISLYMCNDIRDRIIAKILFFLSKRDRDKILLRSSLSFHDTSARSSIIISMIASTSYQISGKSFKVKNVISQQ